MEKKIREATHSMDDSPGMGWSRSSSSEGLRHVLIEPTLLPQNTGNQTARDVFKEVTKPLLAVCRCFMEAKTDLLKCGVTSNPSY